MIDIKNLSKAYGKHQALDSISLTMDTGKIFGLLGPNGAGKTTLIRIINQIIEADQGEITIKGEKLSSKHVSIIGYLPEERGLYKKMKVGEQLIYFGQLRGLSRKETVNRIKRWTQKLGIYDWINHNVEDLSKGMAQKIQFISCILHEPELIILDEPFSGFDPVNANLIKNEILEFRKKGHTIIFSTHRMESAEELCDNICLINKSKVVLNGTKTEIRNSFKKNIYLVEHDKSILSGNGDINVLDESKNEEGNLMSRIQISGISSNELLESLLQQTTIISFKEDIPSLNEIFIELTTSENE